MSKQNGIIATVVTAILVACPSCFCMLFGAVTLTGASTYELGSDVGNLPPSAGIPMLCLGLVGLLIPAAVWFFTVRGKIE